MEYPAQKFSDLINLPPSQPCPAVSVVIPMFNAEKFGGRLKLSHMEKNSGSGALPRNKGLAFSRGEYIFFMDADDLITKTAL